MIKKGILSFTLIATILLGCGGNDQEADNVSKETDSEETVDEKQATNDEQNASDVSLPNAMLQKQDENNAVQQLQQALIALGLPIEQTGVYDEETIWAITEIQLSENMLFTNGIYDQEVKAVIETYVDEESVIEKPYTLTKPEHKEFETEEVENPYDILAVVNKSFSLPDDFEPEDLTVPDVRFPFEEDDPKKQLRKEAAEALEDLFMHADQVGIQLFAQSGFRSFDRQDSIFAANVEQHGEDHANTYSAKAGESEHQTGLVMDVTSEQVGFDLTTDFGATEEGEWVADHAHEHGFIVRYLEGKEDITEYQYEPWHLRFVGIKAATEIKENEQTLEEYLGVES